MGNYDMSGIPMSIGENLKAKRETAGLSQKALAGLIDTAVNTYIGWEHDKNPPPADKVAAIARCMLGQAVNKVAQTQQASSQLANAFEIGKSGVDLTDVMISSQKASVSFQALTQVRNKLVQAYQDIMQMPV